MEEHEIGGKNENQKNFGIRHNKMFTFDNSCAGHGSTSEQTNRFRGS